MIFIISISSLTWLKLISCYSDNSGKHELNDKKKKICSKQRLMIIIFEYLIFYLDDSPPMKFTDIMDKVIEWDPKIRSLAKVDTVNSILKKWTNKFTARLAIQSIKRLINDFSLIHLEIRNSGSESDKSFWKRYDYLIDVLLTVFKHDLEDIEITINTYVNEKPIAATEFWIYLNSAFEYAKRYKHSLVLTLSSNSFITSMYSVKKKPIYLWVAENCDDFDITEYYKLMKENKENNQFNAKLRVLTQTVNKGFKTPLLLPRTPNPKRSTIKNGDKTKVDTPAKKLFAWLVPAFQKIAGPVNWPDKFCGFYQTKDGCTNEKCKRLHKCPVCEQEHKLTDCPEQPNSE